MPNLYVTVDQIKESAPDAIKQSKTDYDEIFYKLAGSISRWIDNTIQRLVFPKLETRTFSLDRAGRPLFRSNPGTLRQSMISSGDFFGSDDFGRTLDDDLLWIDDLITVGTVSFSDDDGQNYTALTSSDFIAMYGFDFNSPESYNLLKVDVNSSVLSTWPRGQKAIKVAESIWGKTEDRDRVFEDTTDSIQNTTGINATETSITFTDVDGADLWGITPRVSRGQILQIESEFLEVTATDTSSGAQTATVVRGRNGTTAVAHANDIQIDKFMPPDPIVQAAIIQVVRQFRRGQVGYGDAQALPDLGQIIQLRTIDPEALELLEPFRRFGVA